MLVKDLNKTAVDEKTASVLQMWGTRARDWADYQENTHVPLYERVFAETRISSGIKLLDVGCGAGLAVQMASLMGAEVSGIDQSSQLLAIAEERSPRCEFHHGIMESLPFDNQTFDVVTGFNSFQFSSDLPNTLREVRRVLKPRGRLAIGVFGRPEDCDAREYLDLVRELTQVPEENAPNPFALADENHLRQLVSDAGFVPLHSHDVECPWNYPDLATALTALLSPGPMVMAIQAVGEQKVRDALIHLLGKFRTADGGYQLKNVFRYLISER